MRKSFVDGYRPETLDEVQGHPTAIDELKAWAINWNKGSDPVLLHGPAGTGKTTTAECLANFMDWGIVEINASSARRTSNIEDIAQQIRSGSFENRKQLFILDEVDSYPKGVSIRPLLKVVEDSPNPIVMTCNEKWKVPDSIVNVCKKHKFTLQKRSIKRVLKNIANEEGIDIDARQLGKLSTRNGLRDALNDLQEYAESQGDIGWDEREQDIGNFKAVDNILRGKKYSGEMTPPDLVEWLDENLSDEFLGVAGMRAFQAISEADKWVQKANETQNYSWWRYAGSIAEEVANMRISEPYDWINKSYPQSRRQSKKPFTNKSAEGILYRNLKESEKPNYKSSFSKSEFVNAVLPILQNLSNEEKYQLILSESIPEDAYSALDVKRSEYEDWLFTEKEETQKTPSSSNSSSGESENASIFDF